MPPFRYDYFQQEPYRNRYAQAIAEAMAQQGQIQARGAEQQGAISAQLGQNLGNLGSNALSQIAQYQNDAPKRAIQQQQLAMGGLQLQEAQHVQAGRSVLAGAMATSLDPSRQPQGPSQTNSNGVIDQVPNFLRDEGNGTHTWDVEGLSKYTAAQGFGDLQPAFVKDITALNDAVRTESAARVATLRQGADIVARSGYDPTIASRFLDTLEANRFYPPEQLAQYRQAIAQNPDALKPLVEGLRTPETFENAPEGSAARAKSTGLIQPGSQVPPKPDKPTAASLAADAMDPTKTPAQRAAAQAGLDALSHAEHPNPPAATAERDDERYRNIQATLTQGQAVPPADLAWAKGYEKQKTLSVDTTAAAAADRQTATINAQIAQQKRSQDFTALQAARADLEKNVNAPYLTAQTSANTLRDVVQAAQNGNKVAASLQALETTMAAIRAQGLNRINTAEIGVTAGAGSTWDRLDAWLGKAKSGQPVPANIQKDMLQFADILEKAAYAKYIKGHDTTTKMYGVTNIQPLAAPASSGPAEGETKPIPGYPGTEQTFRGGQWVRTK